VLQRLNVESKTLVMIATMLSDPAHMRSAGAIPACAFLLSVIVVALANTGGTLAAVENKVSPIVCIEHAGLWSDKPIAPLVVAAVKPPRETLASLLGNASSPDYIHLHLFPEGEVRKLVEEIRKRMEPMPMAEPTAGIVRITVQGMSSGGMESKGEIEARKVSRLLAAEGARKILDVIDHFQPADAEAAKEFKTDLATFKMRSQLK
jgi:hypothetical protein